MALPFPSKYHDADKGEIYIATNKITGKSYVGQAPLFMGINMQSWGGKARWVRHIHEATDKRTKSGKYTDINKAIRKYGKDSFELKILCTCNLSELDDMETKYVKEYNTIEPNGYNMTSGGKSGKHSEAANIKKRKPRKHKNPIKDSESESESDIEIKPLENKIIDKKKVIIKKLQDLPSQSINTDLPKHLPSQSINTDLPKHLYAVKVKDKIVGYRIIKFKIDPETDKIVNKSFIDSSNPENELKKALICIKELELEYQKNKAEYDKNITNLPAIQSDINNLPKYIYPIFNNNVNLMGYSVNGLQSFDGLEIPRRNFTEFTNVHNLDNCVRFIKLIEDYNNKKEKPDDWLTVEIPKRIKDTTLPKYMRETYLKGVHTGYRIDYFISYDKNRKPIIDSKCFTSNKLSLEEKYDLALAYLNELKIKYSK